MSKNETYQEDIKVLLNDEYKIFLNKKCDNGINRHIFYKTQNTQGHHFYHIRYVLTDNDEVQSLKDYPSIYIPCNSKEELTQVIDETTEKIMKFIQVNGYEVSCNRKEN